MGGEERVEDAHARDGHDLRRIPVRDPAPVYPHALVRRRSNPHPALAALRAYLAAARPKAEGELWKPGWSTT
ncbi:hypothetical protein [Streptomyces sp. NBC_01166]|uniref:hypothetical protein n=1 Tax=Streptomyces sp. NBC_01166 TaxID=2903755 RepID=UPI00386FF964